MLRTLFKLGKGTNSRQRCTLRTDVTGSSSSGGKCIVKVLDDVISRLIFGIHYHYEFSARENVCDHRLVQRREGNTGMNGRRRCPRSGLFSSLTPLSFVRERTGH